MKVLLKWFILVVGLSLFIYVFLYAQTDSMNEKSQQYKERGQAYLDQYERSRNKDDVLKAIEEFKKWKEIDESEHAYYWLGVAYNTLGDLNKAEELYLKALTINPNYLNPLDSLAYLYSEQGKYKQAIEYFEKVYRGRPNNPDLPLQIAGVQLQRGEYKKAIKYANESLKLEPNRVEAYIIIAKAYRYLGDFKKAIQTLKKAENIAPFYSIIYFHFALIYYDFGDYSQALPYAKKYITLDPNSGWGYLVSAIVLRKQGEKKLMNEAIKKAEDCYRAQLGEGADTDISALRGLARLYTSFDIDSLKALEYAQEAIKFDKRIQVQQILARAYYQNKRYKEALDILTKIIDINANHAVYWYELGMVHKSLGDIDSALQAFEKSLTLNPKTFYQKTKEEIKKIKKK